MAAAAVFVLGCRPGQTAPVASAPPGAPRTPEPAASAPPAPPCAATLGQAVCDDRCVALERDAAHCGGCGVECAAGERCELGLCTAALEGEASVTAEPTALPAGTWRALGPALGGRLTAIVAKARGDGERIIVGSPGGGLWRSDDAGESWVRAAARGLADGSVVHLELDRSDPTRLYVATFGDLYATTDDGDTVERLTTATRAIPSTMLSSDPRAFAQLACGDGTTRVFRGPPCGGLEYSLESGRAGTFRTAFGGATGDGSPHCLVAIAADQSTGRVYLSDSNGHEGAPRLYASAAGCSWCEASCQLERPDGGWVRLEARGLPDTDVAPPGLAWTGAPGRLTVVLQDARARRMRAYETLSSGATWALRGELPLEGANPNDRFLLWAGGERLFWGSVEAFTSGDRGRTWRTYDVLRQHVDVRAIFASEALGRVYNATDGTLADGSAHNVARWRWKGPAADPECEAGTASPCESGGLGHRGLAVLQPFHATAGAGARTFLGTMDNGVVCTDDGERWKPVTSLVAGDAIALVTHPVRKDIAYAVTNGGWMRSTNADAPDCSDLTFHCPDLSNQSAACRQTVPFSWSANTLAVDPRGAIDGHTGGHDIVATLKGTQVVVTLDGGQTWLDAARPMADAVTIDDAGHLYAGTRTGVYRCTRTLPASAEYCRTHTDWEPLGLNDASPTRVLGVRVARSADGGATYWAATTSGLFRGAARAGASTPRWDRVTGGGGVVVSDVEVVPGAPHCIFAGLGFAKRLVQHAGGVRFSSDGGASWRALTVGTDLHAAPVSDVVVRSAGRIGVSGYGRGYWEYVLDEVAGPCAGER